jgi:hypothetical protein
MLKSLLKHMLFKKKKHSSHHGIDIDDFFEDDNDDCGCDDCGSDD